MSYKHALALTAFGIGAVLQGCGEDEEKTCTVNCEDKCKDITDYEKLEKSSTYETDCGTCIGNRLGSVKGDDLDTDIKKWAKALADVKETGATDAQKALPLQALQYCGAKQVADACANTDPVDYVTEIADIDAAVLLLANPNCLMCHNLVASTDCATAKTGLTACGNAPAFDCALDYSCHDVVTFHDIKDSDDAVVAGCKTCLDEEAAAADPSLTDYATASNADAADQTSDRFAKISELWDTCGAHPFVTSCTGVAALTSYMTFEAIMTNINAYGATDEDIAFNCGVCVASQTSSTSTCAELKAATVACGFADNLVCDACQASASYGAECVSCADSIAGSSIVTLAAHTSGETDAVWSNVIVDALTQCGADSFDGVVHSDSCGSGDIDLSALTLSADVAAELVSKGTACDLCVSYHVATINAGVRNNCDFWVAAATACSSGTVTAPAACTA